MPSTADHADTGRMVSPTAALALLTIKTEGDKAAADAIETLRLEIIERNERIAALEAGRSGEAVCRVCDGGPGNAGVCLCGAKAYDTPAPDRELIRRLYVELLWCDRQLVDRGCTQGTTVRDVLADALAHLKATPAAPQQPPPAKEFKEPAPRNSLPSWSECQLRVENTAYVVKRIAEGGHGADPDVPLATQLHSFIYEYDDADPYRSAWFLHRLELLLDETRAEARRESQQPTPVGVTDAPGTFAWMAEVCRAAHGTMQINGLRNDQLPKVADWIASLSHQQPAPSVSGRD